MVALYFTAKYGLKVHRNSPPKPAHRGPRQHKRTLKRVTREKNMARRELRASRREGKDEGVIKEVARNFTN